MDEKTTVFTADHEEPDCGRCDNINAPDSFCCGSCGALHGWDGYRRTVIPEDRKKTGVWAEKEKRAKEAVRHTEEMHKKYGDEIAACVSGTRIYNEKDMKGTLLKNASGEPRIALKDTDSVSAVMMAAGKYGKTAVLNFSSYKNPGGKYIEGSRAQEECLCAESILYNVLREKTEDFYRPNREDLNRALYREKALYTPDVVFFREKKTVKCDVITCAAPNASACRKYGRVQEEEIDKALKRRIFFVCAIAEKEKVETLILGAYGCGVFGNDPSKVGEHFLEAVRHTHVRNVLFAVPGGDGDRNYRAIKEKIEKEK